MSKLIKELCHIAGTEKSRTTPYHAMGNGQCERFNQTLLKMLGTLEDYQKSDWKAHVPTLVHAYNATFHDSTGYSPYFLMFGRHPRLAIDAFLGLSPDALLATTHTEYIRKLQERLHFAYQKARAAAERSAAQHKTNYDLKVRSSALYPGDRVLVRNIGLKGKQKLADRWERQPYIVRSQPNPGIPVYEVPLENSRSKKIRTLHRNLLLPFMSIPCDRQQPYADVTLLEAAPTEDTETMSEHGNQDRSKDISDHFSYNEDSHSNDQDSDRDSQATERYVIPMCRKPGAPGLLPRSNHEQNKEESQGRPSRTRRKPTWMNTNDWVLGQQHTFGVDRNQVAYL